LKFFKDLNKEEFMQLVFLIPDLTNERLDFNSEIDWEKL
jgi:hypothetical protein